MLNNFSCVALRTMIALAPAVTSHCSAGLLALPQLLAAPVNVPSQACMLQRADQGVIREVQSGPSSESRIVVVVLMGILAQEPLHGGEHAMPYEEKWIRYLGRQWQSISCSALPVGWAGDCSRDVMVHHIEIQRSSEREPGRCRRNPKPRQAANTISQDKFEENRYFVPCI